MRKKAKLHNSAQSGSAIAEFVLVILFLLFVSFSLYDCYSYYHVQQVLSTVVRELGNSAFRYCPDVEDGAKMNTCLETVANQIVSYSSGSDEVLSDVEVVLRVYRYNSADPSDPIFAGEHKSGSAASLYTDAIVAGDTSSGTTKLHSYSANKEALIIVEAFFLREVLIGVFPELVYQTAIY